ncbi:MAG: MotA/TolQ/ExbB proton channel family protein [Lachnospiraceae bacterium]|nr:MotA/TolQ/ExbB proton channel family protein [Lachnospiraceae bacterium]MEE0958636.1 MotA/TolQ/ExbB proton channel family protein [Lachnospiraceae bacterium]
MKLNKAGITGFVLCFTAILFGIATNGGMETIISYLHLPSLLVTVGGSFFAVMATMDSFEDLIFGLSGFIEAFRVKGRDIDHVCEEILYMSDIARREGILALEDRMQSMDNSFLKKGMTLVIDGADPELIKDIMDIEMTHRYEKERERVKFWQDFGAYGPAWGMVGTLIGLINMMKNMGSDPSSIGEGMSLALITTLYGSVLANWICIPIARKLDKNCSKEYLEMELITTGTLSIQAGENTRIIKEKIQAIIEREDEENKTQPVEKAA